VDEFARVAAGPTTPVVLFVGVVTETDAAGDSFPVASNAVLLEENRIPEDGDRDRSVVPAVVGIAVDVGNWELDRVSVTPMASGGDYPFFGPVNVT
jgi:hypothetical protein